MQRMELETEQRDSQVCLDKRTIHSPAHSWGTQTRPQEDWSKCCHTWAGRPNALRRFLGMVNYLSKFMPHLSKITELLPRLEDKDAEWQWLVQHSIMFNTVKKYLTESPVLKYYNINEQVTIKCDASKTGLGAVLRQKGQPVCYTSRALTDIETRYGQIEKEVLAIVCSYHTLSST